jgi:hypothetical protein
MKMSRLFIKGISLTTKHLFASSTAPSTALRKQVLGCNYRNVEGAVYGQTVAAPSGAGVTRPLPLASTHQ